MATKPAATGLKKKKVKRNVPAGVVHIKASFNNTIITFTDVNGDVVAWSGTKGLFGNVATIGVKDIRYNERMTSAYYGKTTSAMDVISGKADKVDNALKNAPHTAQDVSATEWNHKYTREQAAYPVASLRQFKFWPTISRIDNPYGDRNLMCACPPLSEYE